MQNQKCDISFKEGFMNLPLFHRDRNSNQVRSNEKTWQQAWSKAVDLIENPLSQRSFWNASPPITVKQNEKEVEVVAEVPGMCNKDINLSFQDGVLSISGEKKEENTQGDIYKEISYGYFSREIPLGKNLEWNMAKAQCQNGLLTVKIPKKEGGVSKVKIQIE